MDFSLEFSNFNDDSGSFIIVHVISWGVDL